MAYNTRYILRFNSEKYNHEYKILVKEKDYTGEAENKSLGSTPVLRRDDSDSGISGTSLELVIQADVDGELTSLYTVDNKKFLVELYRNDVLIWCGYILPEKYSEPYIAVPYDVSVTASDGLGILKNIQYSQTGTRSIFDIIKYCCDQTSLPLDFEISFTLLEKAMSKTDSVLHQTTLNTSAFEGCTCYEVLEQCMTSLDAFITQSMNRWLICSYVDVNKSGYIYSNTGNKIGNIERELLVLGTVGDACYPIGNLGNEIIPASKDATFIYDYNKRPSFLVNYNFRNELNGWNTEGKAFYRYSVNDVHFVSLSEKGSAYQQIDVEKTIQVLSFSVNYCSSTNPIWWMGQIPETGAFSITIKLTDGVTTKYLSLEDGWRDAEYSFSRSSITKKMQMFQRYPFSDTDFEKLEITADGFPFTGKLEVRFQDTTNLANVKSHITNVVVTHIIEGGVDVSAELVNAASEGFGDMQIAFGDTPFPENADLLFNNVLHINRGGFTSGWSVGGKEDSFLYTILKCVCSRIGFPRRQLSGTIQGENLQTFMLFVDKYSDSLFYIKESSLSLLTDEMDVTLEQFMPYVELSGETTESERTTNNNASEYRSSGENEVRVYQSGSGVPMRIKDLSPTELQPDSVIEVDRSNVPKSGKATLQKLLEFLLTTGDVWTKEELRVVDGYILYLGEKIKAGDSDLWEGNRFADYLNQAVKTDSDVKFKSIESTDFESKVKGWLIDALGDAEFRDILGRIITITGGLMTDDFIAGMTGAGTGIVNKSELHTDRGVFRKYIEVLALVVSKMYWRGGRQCLSPAGMKVSKVEEYADYWRLYMETEDGQTNDFTVGAQARCNNYGNGTQKYYWRLVTGIGENYADLSKTDCDTGSGTPAAGDDVVQFGHRTDPYLQWVVMDSSFSDDAGRTIYAGVNSYDLSDKMVLRIGVDPKDQSRIGIFTRHGEFSDVVDVIKKDIEDSQQAIQDAKDAANAIQTVVDNLTGIIIPDMQNQLDGAIQSWDGEVEPTLNNYPANEWTTPEEKSKHVGDTYIYYTTDSEGNTVSSRYNFRLVDGVYKWEKVADSVSAELEVKLRELTGTVGKKNSITYSNNVPTPAYNIDDLWIKEDGSMYICRAQKLEGMQGSAADWELFNDTMLRLAKMADDGIISKEEKASLRDDLKQIEESVKAYQAQATKYGVSITALQNAYNILNTFLTDTVKVGQNIDTSLTVAQKTTYNQNFANYYSEVTAFSNLISQKVSGDAVDNLQIGGTNLLSYFKDSGSWWENATYDKATGVIRGQATGNDVYPRLYNKSVASLVLDLDSEYTISFKIRSNKTNSRRFVIADADSSNAIFAYTQTGELSGNWKEVKCTFKPLRQITSNNMFQVYTGDVITTPPYDATSWIEIKDVKLEKGNKATDFSWSIPDQEFIAKEQGLIGGQEAVDGLQIGSVNLISRKMMLAWNEKDKDIAVWGQDADGVYLSVNPALLRGYIAVGEECKDIFIGEGNYKPNTQYVFSIEWKTTTTEEKDKNGLYLRVFYTDGSDEWIFAASNQQINKKRTDYVTAKGKTIQKISSTYGYAINCLIYSIGLFEGNKILPEIPVATEDLTGQSNVNLVDGGKEVTVTAGGSSNTYFKALVIPKLKPNTVYHLSFKAENLVGTPTEYKAEIRNTNVNVEYAGLLSVSGGILITTNNFTDGEGRLCLFAGKYGSTAGNSVKYTDVMFVEGFTAPSSYSPSPGDVAKDIKDVSDAVTNLNITITGAFKDGIIDEAEAKAIASNINILNSEKADIDAYYTKLYANAYLTGTAKTNLASAKTAYNTAHANLISSINTAIADGKATAAEKADVNAKFTAYNTALSTYKTRVGEADKAIQDAVRNSSIQDVTKNSKYYVGQMSTSGTHGVCLFSTTIPEKTYIMTRVDFEGYMYGNDTPFGVSLVFYTYSTGLSSYGYTVTGTDIVSGIRLGVKNGKIGIEIKLKQNVYYPCFNITVMNVRETLPIAYSQGWTFASQTLASGDLIDSTYTNVVTVPMKDTLAGSWAKAAQVDADAANALLADIASDNKLTPSEKQETKKEWDIIVSERATIVAQAATYNVSSTTYTNAYNALNTYITPLLASLTTTSSIVGTTFRSTFKTYYDTKIALLKAVTDAAKQFTRDEVDNIQVGGTNIFPMTKLNHVNYNGSSSKEGSGAEIVFKCNNPSTWAILPVSIPTPVVPANTDFVISMDIRNTNNFGYEVTATSSTPTLISIVRFENTTSEWKRVSKVFNSGSHANIGGINLWGVGDVRHIKIEIGNKATDWSLAPEDIQEEIDNVDPGTRNLITNRQNIITSGADYPAETEYSSVLNSKGEREVTVRAITANDNGRAYRYAWIQQILSTPVVPDFYVFSFDYKTNHTGGFIEIDWRGDNVLKLTFNKSLENTGGTWKRGYFLCDWRNGTTQSKNLFLVGAKNSAIGNYVSYRNIKLVRGNRGWDDSPAPEDVNTDIQEAKTTTKDDVAKQLGFTNFEALKANAVTKGPLVKAGMINTALLTADALIAVDGFIDKLKTNILKANSISANMLSVAGFTFADNKIIGGSDFGSGAGIKITSTTAEKSFKAYKDASHYVEMFYRSASDWGLKGVDGNPVFQLGSTNKIGPFIFNKDKLHATISGGGVLQLSANGISFSKTDMSGSVSMGIDSVVDAILYVSRGDIKHSNGTLYGHIIRADNSIVCPDLYYSRLCATNKMKVTGTVYAPMQPSSVYFFAGSNCKLYLPEKINPIYIGMTVFVSGGNVGGYVYYRNYDTSNISFMLLAHEGAAFTYVDDTDRWVVVAGKR